MSLSHATISCLVIVPCNENVEAVGREVLKVLLCSVVVVKHYPFVQLHIPV